MADTVQAVAKYMRISPRKARPLARSLAGLKVEQALGIVEFKAGKAAQLIGQTLKSAVANAENNDDLERSNLRVDRVFIEPGPSLKRYWPRSRGLVHPIRKRTSHIRVVLRGG